MANMAPFALLSGLYRDTSLDEADNSTAVPDHSPASSPESDLSTAVGFREGVEALAEKWETRAKELQATGSLTAGDVLWACAGQLRALLPVGDKVDQTNKVR